MICLSVIFTTAKADNEEITRDTSLLPENSRNFISTYFGQADISHIKIEKFLFRVKNYDVILTDGTNVEFDSSGEWQEIDGNKTSIPNALIPKEIQSYLQTSFVGKKVVSIERERGKYDVVLENGLELTFDKQGRLIEIDD